MLNKLRISIALGAVAALFLACMPLGAVHSLARARIPFEFVVNGEVLPAGTYQFQAGEWQGLVSVYADSGRRHMVAVTPLDGPGAARRARLIFVRSGATHRLSEIWFSNGVAGKTPAPRPSGEGPDDLVAIQLL